MSVCHAMKDRMQHPRSCEAPYYKAGTLAVGAPNCKAGWQQAVLRPCGQSKLQASQLLYACGGQDAASAWA